MQNKAEAKARQQEETRGAAVQQEAAWIKAAQAEMEARQQEAARCHRTTWIGRLSKWSGACSAAPAASRIGIAAHPPPAAAACSCEDRNGKAGF